MIVVPARRAAFQFTTSQGGRLDIIQCIYVYPLLSIHDLTRRPTERGIYLFSGIVFFQFTTSQGGRLIPVFQKLFNRIFQFTTSQGGRLSFSGIYLHSILLSIHDLTRRSTITKHSTRTERRLSIHDLTRRSTMMIRQRI